MLVSLIHSLALQWLLLLGVLSRTRTEDPERSSSSMSLLSVATGSKGLAFSVSLIATFAEAGRRASTLAMVNMTPLFAGFHHAFLADLLGLPLKTIRGIHRSARLMTCGLLLLHAMIAASEASLPLNVPQNLFAVVLRFLGSLLR